jgi:hypothetical protein
MRLSFAELERFYEGLVTKARGQGITCAITSGMACVEYGIACESNRLGVVARCWRAL